MKWLIPVLASIGAAAVGVFFWRRKPKPSTWARATDATSSAAKAAAGKAGSAAAAAADGVKGAVAH